MVEVFTKKIISQSKENSGPVSNQPDRPLVAKTPLGGLSLILSGRHRRGSSPGSVFESHEAVIEPGRYNPPARGVVLVHTTERPLTPVFRVEYGGGRVYGGGTSAEALRRAKRKARATGLK